MQPSQYRNRGLSASVSVAQSLSLGVVIQMRSILHVTVHNCMKSGNRLEKNKPSCGPTGRQRAENSLIDKNRLQSANIFLLQLLQCNLKASSVFFILAHIFI